MEDERIKSTVYIDKAGDLGVGRGTQWFVLTAVIIDKDNESNIRNTLQQIKTRLNVKDIHLRKITDFNKRGYIVRELSDEAFTYINVIADTDKFNRAKISSSTVAYNYLCRMLLERASWFLNETNRVADIVLSSRGTSRDGELIDYIKNKLVPYSRNEIKSETFNKVTAKPAGSWDMLQLADVCATTMFLVYEKNGWGFRLPCYSKVLKKHLYKRNGKSLSYGVKYFTPEMQPEIAELECGWVCTQKKERIPGATTT